MSEPLGPEELRPLVESVIAAHPDAVNPRADRGGCLYTDPVDATRHCVVGQLAADLGWPLPDPHADPQRSATWLAPRLEWPVTAAGADWLTRVQVAADNAAEDGKPWATIEIPVAS